MKHRRFTNSQKAAKALLQAEQARVQVAEKVEELCLLADKLRIQKVEISHAKDAVRCIFRL